MKHLSLLSDAHQTRLHAVRAAGRKLRHADSEKKNAVLLTLTELLSSEESNILKANARDLDHVSPDQTSAFRDRLTLTSARLESMKDSLRQVAALSEPIGETVEERALDNGLKLKKVRAPLGVILMIFEARPNVITEAFSLAFKASNALIMRGGSESKETSEVLYHLVEKALMQHGFDAHCFWGITDTDRNLVQALMKQNELIDVLVPRGGDRLIEYVTENALIPIIKNDRGMCHIYLDESLDSEMALSIVANAKLQRPGVCNSVETLLIHSKQRELLPRLHERLREKNVKWHVCPETLSEMKDLLGVEPARPENFDQEYLDYEINCRLVSSLDEALDHIERHGSKHSECIVTDIEANGRRFQASIDAAAVYWNASTRFTDGYQFGLGGELGISTQKLHVRGPVGLLELTSLRWVVEGTGQTRT